MKTIYTLLTIVSLSFLFSACDSNTDNIEDVMYDTNTYTATFEVYMNDQLIQKGSNAEVGMMQTMPSQWANIVTVDNDSIIGIIISGIPRTVGNVVIINNETEPEDEDDDENSSFVTLDGWNLFTSSDRDETYFSLTGSVTRTSSTKISFEGTCAEILNSENIISFRGFISSDAFKNIK